MNKLDISVVIPTFNRQEILKETLKRIFDQTFDKNRYEVIVADDGSNDGTDELIGKLESPVAFRYLKSPNNIGRAKIRNLGISAARGEYVLLLDDDIWAERDLLEKHYSAHHDLGGNAVVIGNIPVALNVQPTIWNKYLADRYSRIIQAMGKNAADLTYNFLLTGHLSLKRTIFESVGYFSDDFKVYGGEDTEFGIRLKQNNYHLIFCKEAIGWHYFMTDLTPIIKKAKQSGCSAYLLVLKYPELYRDMQFHSIFYKDAPLWKNALKCLTYSGLAVDLNEKLVRMMSKVRAANKITLLLLGLLEWQCYAEGVRRASRENRD